MLGKEFEIISSTGAERYFLSVNNTEDKKAIYEIKILSCKKYGCSAYIGYKDIPDIKWITVKLSEIVIPAKQTGYVRDVYIKIPKNKKHYNQKWQGIVKVIKNVSAGETINLEVVLPLLIETERK